ncbi:MAG: SIS domain-containing protein [Oscillospiraceae bacterium]
MLLIDRYHERINQQITKVEQSQRETCMKVGEVMAQCVKNGGCVHVFDTGHIINSELIYRGGGVLFLKAFKYDLAVEDAVRTRDRSGVDQDMTGLAAYALKKSGALPGDVIVIGSVSGKTANVVDLAIEAKKFGMTVVAMTSVDYSSSVPSMHSSGNGSSVRGLCVG